MLRTSAQDGDHTIIAPDCVVPVWRDAMIQSSEYREFAEICLGLTDRALPHEKLALRVMAEIWLKLAAKQFEQESALGQNAPTTSIAQ